MKAKNYFVLILLLRVSFGYAQCTVDAGEDLTITCGDSVQLYGDRNWHVGFNETSYQAYDIFFTNDLIGYTVGDAGSIRKTTDGGISWLSQISNASMALRSVYFVSSDSGIVVGDNGTILRTIDGGINWVPQGGVTSETLNAVFFTDTNTGFAVGTNGIILKTTDNGANWTKKGSITNGLGSVHFPSDNVGYVLSGKGVYKTTNGGESWSILPTVIENVDKLFFVSETVGYMTGRGNITPGIVYKTIDGGNSWTALSINYGYGTSGIFFLNENEGYVGTVGKIFKTNDGGKNWISQQIGFMNLSAIHFPSAKVGYAVGYTLTPAKVTKYSTPDMVTWSPASGLNISTILNPVASPIVTTTYKVTTTTGTCIAIDSIKIIVSKLTADAGADQTITCGGSVQLNASSNFTGKGQLQYSWNPTLGLNSKTIANPVVTTKQTTTYTVTITTPNGCTATDTVKVFVNPFSVDAGADKYITCGDKAQFDAPITNYTGNGILSYSWSPSNSLDNATIATPVSNTNKETVYHVTVSTPNGCIAIDSFTLFINPLQANSLGDVALICGGSSQLKGIQTNYIGTDALTYSWSPSTGLDNAAIEKPTATATKNTTYHVLVKTANGCEANDSVKVIVNPLIVNAGADKVHVCGETSQFDMAISNYTGTDALTYSWLPTTGLNNAAIINPTTTASGIVYTLTVSTLNGCKASDQVEADLIKMNAPEICMVGVDSTNKNVIRWNNLLPGTIDSVAIYKETTVTGNYIKIGSSLASKNEFRDVTSQPEVKSSKYKISILDSCGLESSKSLAHKTMHLSITKGVGSSWNLIWESYEGFTVPTYNIYRGTDASKLQFIDATSGTSNQFTNYNPPPGDLYYQIEVVNPSPCTTENLTGPLRSNVAKNSIAVGIFERENSFNLTLYPNPAADFILFTVENIEIKNASLIIYNALGAIMKTVLLEQNKQQINVGDLNNGFYTVEIKSANGCSQQKLIIQK